MSIRTRGFRANYRTLPVCSEVLAEISKSEMRRCVEAYGFNGLSLNATSTLSGQITHGGDEVYYPSTKVTKCFGECGISLSYEPGNGYNAFGFSCGMVGILSAPRIEGEAEKTGEAAIETTVDSTPPFHDKETFNSCVSIGVQKFGFGASGRKLGMEFLAQFKSLDIGYGVGSNRHSIPTLYIYAPTVDVPSEDYYGIPDCPEDEGGVEIEETSAGTLLGVELKMRGWYYSVTFEGEAPENRGTVSNEITFSVEES